MSKRNDLADKIKAIPNMNTYIQEYYSNEILIADIEHKGKNKSYILKNIDIVKNVCNIEVNGSLIESTFEKIKVFGIYNSTTIIFIPTDGYGIFKNMKSCDFIFFNDKNFCFVELKLNATSLDERKIEDNRNEAIKQLKGTISFFDTNFNRDYSGLELEAFVATPDIYPRENTAFQSLKVRFLEDIGIELFESREKVY